MNYTRVLHPSDYELFDGWKDVDSFIDKYKGKLPYRYEHIHRKWEYGLALDFIRSQKDIKTILEVGGGGSPLSPLLALNGYDVVESDIAFGEEEVKKQNEILGTDIKFWQVDFSLPRKDLMANEPRFMEDVDLFDAVICISTIEHVVDHMEFFDNLCLYSGRALFITTDFHPSGTQLTPAHLRTANSDLFDKYRLLAQDYSLKNTSDELEYMGNFVYDYTFASLAFTR